MRFAEGGDTATFAGETPLLGLQFASPGGFTLAKGGAAAALTVSTGGIDVAEWNAARTYTVAVPTAFSGAQTWTVPASQTLAFEDAMTGSDGKITIKGKNGALEFRGTNVIGGAMVVTGHTVFVTGLLGTPGHENQGTSSNGGAKTLTIDTNATGDMKGLTVSNAVVEKPLYFHCKSGYGFIKAPAATTNVFKGFVTWTSPWIGQTVEGDAELIFEGGMTTGYSTRNTGGGTVRIRNTPIRAEHTMGWNINNGALVIETPGNTFSYLTLGYGRNDNFKRELDLTVSSALTTNSYGVLGIGFGYYSNDDPFAEVAKGTAKVFLHSTTQQVNVLAGAKIGAVWGDEGARIEVMKQETCDRWAEKLLYFASQVNGPVTIAMQGTGTLLMTNQAFASTGDIEVSAGGVHFAENASWLDGAGVTVKGTGRLTLDRCTIEGAKGQTFGRQAEWAIDGDGVVELAEGISQKCRLLTIGDRAMPKGKYGSASAPGVPPENVSAHFDGLGVLNVVGDGYGATFTIR